MLRVKHTPKRRLPRKLRGKTRAYRSRVIQASQEYQTNLLTYKQARLRKRG